MAQKAERLVHVRHHGMDGLGATLTAARQDAGRKIEAALDGSYTPELFCHRGYAILVFREPAGWCQRVVATPEGLRAGRVWAAANHDSFEEAKRAALAHLADLGWVPGDGEEPPSFLTCPWSVAEFQSKARWQARYRQGRQAGLDDHEAHAFACGMRTL